MNRQYSGDTRDLFKIDLVCHIMKKMPSLESFTFVPMLTAGDVASKKKRGKNPKKNLAAAVKKGKPGSRNNMLVGHLTRLQEIDNDLEYFRGIQSLFRKEQILIGIFDGVPFSHKARDTYFTTFLEQIPEKSLIFLDPDIGLEEKRPSKRHLLLEEVARIFDRMDRKSILMIYQHFPRRPRTGYTRYRCDQLKGITGWDPVTITDNEILFLLIPKDSFLQERIRKILKGYSDSYHPHVGMDAGG